MGRGCLCVVRASPAGVSLLYHGGVDKRMCLCDTTDYCCLVSAQKKAVRGLWRDGSSTLLL